MRVLLLILALILGGVSTATAQQESPDDRGYLQALLEDSLSDAGREVRITGFSGALSSRATIDELTIADSEGIWLSLQGLTLDWTRSALLTGRLSIDALTARKVTLRRLPAPQPGLTANDSLATSFKLPDLPVSVDIGALRIDTLTLDSALLGEPATLRLDGRVSLAGGAGAARLTIARTDRRNDAFTLDASYDNESRDLALDARLNEARGGLISGLLNLPGRPALALTIAGEAPITAYSARISLLSDDKLRLSGDVTLTGQPDDSLAFASVLAGNIAPLFQPGFQPFFGHSSGLEIRGLRHPDGAIDISALSLSAAALNLQGQLSLDAGGWPTRFDLAGTIGDGTPVTLPLSGPQTRIASAEIEARFDADRAENWQARIHFRDLTRAGLSVADGQLAGHGQIRQRAPRGLNALINFDLTRIAHTDPDQSRVLGPALAGRADLRWQEETGLTLNDIEILSGQARLRGAGTLGALADGLPVAGSAHLSAPDLARFASLTRHPLTGRATAFLKGRADLLGGAFDLYLQARTNPLGTGIAQLDSLLSQPTELSLKARRDTQGTRIDHLHLRNALLETALSGQLTAQSGHLNVTARLADAAVVEPRLSGPVSLTTEARWQAGQDIVVPAFSLSLADAVMSGSGTLTPGDPALPVNGQITASLPDLSAFRRLALRPLSGALRVQASGSGTLRAQTFSATIDATGETVHTGQPDLDRLLVGPLSLHFAGGRTAQALHLEAARLETPQISANIAGTQAGDRLDVALSLSDLALLAPGFSGRASATGRAQINAADLSDLTLELDANGPGGTTAHIAGAVAAYGQSLRLALSGAAPLALANRFIAPRSLEGMARYDLRLDGPPALSSLTGSVTTAKARVALPALNAALEDISGAVTLAAQRAQVDLSGAYRNGGRISVSGPVSLRPPFPGDLAVTLSNLHLSDRIIYETTANGALSVTGPLAGGAKIGGTINLAKTNIRIPSGSSADSVSLPGLRHIAEPAAVHATRARAGLLAKPGARSGATRPFPLDLTINAPKRIFVRGRGLDAELGGKLHLAGTTADVAPSGVVELIRGRMDLLGKRLELSEGLIDLRGAFDPYLRFVAETTADDTTVQIVIEGLASDPQITFQSQPDLPQEEIVSRLLFGRGLANISAFQAAQMASAVATLTGRSKRDLVGRLRKAVGLSDLDVQTGDNGTTEVSAGAYLSDKVYSEVTVDNEGKREIHLNLDLSRSVTAKGRVNNLGETGLGLFFEKDY